MMYKIVRKFVDKKTGLPHSGQYGRSCPSRVMAEKQLAEASKDYPGYQFVIVEEDTPSEPKNKD
jgi:hypothetical protein